MTKRRDVKEATGTPCAQCPWRLSNHGKPHPDGWYTRKNRMRLWAGMRRGEAMTCHPTDPNNPLPEGWREVPKGVETVECTGAIILQQREMDILQKILQDGGRFADYRKLRSNGLTRDGAAVMVSRLMFGGVPAFGGMKMPLPDLNQTVGHDTVPWPLFQEIEGEERHGG